MKKFDFVVMVMTLATSLHGASELSVSTKLLGESIPGAVMTYEHTISNPTETIANDLVFSDIIPLDTSYVPNSASCSGECTIEYSIDGEVFEKASELFVYHSSLMLGNPKDYRFIRWTFEKLEVSSKQILTFKTKID